MKTTMSENLPALPEPSKAEQVQARVLAAIDKPAVRQTLIWRLDGYSWKQCVAKLKEEGLKSPQGGDWEVSNLHKQCSPYLRMIQQDAGFQALKSQVLSVAMEATAQMSEALANGEINKQSIPVAFGIAVDKLARMEAVSRPPEVQTNPLLSAIAKMVSEGGNLKLEVTQPKPAIDVEVVK